MFPFTVQVTPLGIAETPFTVNGTFVTAAVVYELFAGATIVTSSPSPRFTTVESVPEPPELVQVTVTVFAPENRLTAFVEAEVETLLVPILAFATAHVVPAGSSTRRSPCRQH